jgi:signal transduction histidine kinase
MTRRRHPRRTLRTQLTLLYAVPFFISGTLLLAVPLVGVKETVHAGPDAAPTPSAPPATDVHRVFTNSAIGLAVMAVVSLGIGWLIAGRFLKPLRTITATARDISATNLDRRLDLSGHNEFTELGDTLDDLFARLHAAFESQRHFVANASHELRTPLTAERTLLQVALADPEATTDSLRAACQEALTLGEGQERLIAALLTLASSEQPIARREPLDLADIARGVVVSRRDEAERRRIHVDARLQPAPATGDPRLVESLIANLVDNAVRHNFPDGRVEIATMTIDGRGEITVRNTGPVVPPDQVDRLFQPFQRIDGQRLRHHDGHGLGLAIVRAIAVAHDATLMPCARSDGGLDIRLTFTGDRS